MLIRRTGLSVALGTALLVLATAAMPAAAYRERGTTGTVGEHSLTDTRSSPGAECTYRFQDRGTAWELRRLLVKPPNVRAVAGEGAQEVGWKFQVHRRAADAFHEDPGPWEHRYTSPVQKATTDPSHDAEFSAMAVRIDVPGNPGEDAWFEYRVIVKAIWYRPNGNVMGTAEMRVEWFRRVTGDGNSRQRWVCRSSIS